MSVNRFIAENIDVLQSLMRALHAVSDQQYTTIESSLFHASIGQHTRHIIDHYDLFVSGIESNSINYDARSRETKIETDKNLACERLLQVVDKFDAMVALDELSGDKVLDIVMDISPAANETDNTEKQRSSITRELTFLHSHTTHHLATLSVMFRFFGLEVDRDFGYAPATIRYLRVL